MTDYTFLEKIVSNPNLHARWLETLSYLEGCGAKKIINHCPLKNMDIDIIRHATEETRHFFFFKSQIRKLKNQKSKSSKMLGGIKGKNYLNLLDVKIAKLLKKKVSEESFKNSCYILTTYAIEKRAEALYIKYDNVLSQHCKQIRLHAVLREELGHLNEMKNCLKRENLLSFVGAALDIEGELFSLFINEIRQEL